MSLLLNSILLISTFYLLTIICDKYFVPALEALGKRLKMNSEMAGATLMAVGSSAPELFTSLFAIFRVWDEVNIWAGTIVGSAIFNVLVIIWASALYMKKKQKLIWQPIARDMTFYTISILMILFFFWDGKIVLWETAVLVGVYLIYIFAVKNWKKWLKYSVDKASPTDLEEPEDEDDFFTILITKLLSLIIKRPRKHYVFAFFVSVVFIGVLSHFMVESAVAIANELSIPASIIWLTVLAVGTSVPDLMSSIIVAKKWKADMAVSNALGSNVFDILIGLWLVYLISFTVVNRSIPYITIDTENLISSVLLLLWTVITVMSLLLIQRWSLGKKSGIFLIMVYVFYMGYNIYWVIVQPEELDSQKIEEEIGIDDNLIQ